MNRQVGTSPTFRIIGGVAFASAVFGTVAVVWLVNSRKTEGLDAFALAAAYARSSPEVISRVGSVVSTAFAPGESHCESESGFPPTGDATFTLWVAGSRAHVKLDVRATRDAQHWHLVDAKVRSTDDAQPAVASSCSSGPAWGPAGNYGKH